MDMEWIFENWISLFAITAEIVIVWYCWRRGMGPWQVVETLWDAVKSIWALFRRRG